MDGVSLSFPKDAPPRAPKERRKAMKRLICAALALSMLGATAASAQPYRHGGYGYGGSWHRHDDTGALVGLGLGLFALGAIVAASNHDRSYDRYEYAPPPPPPPAYYGPAYGY
jgi:hypothetical protein